jgi:amino acid transporter
MSSHNHKKDPQGRFGSFAGVFTPNVLTIMGLILFLRTGWTVGQVGLAGALLIIVLAHTISFLTGLSVSAIATDMRVKTGGAYYMISRSLGLEIGGAIGVPLYLSQAISVAFYIIGFSEALTLTFPIISPLWTSVGLVLFFGGLAYVGADFVIRIQYAILAVLVLAMISLFSGAATVGPDSAGTVASAVPSKSFWETFAVFFPAVTGIMVGVSMSGDLKDPRRDIPRGTLVAIGTTALVYMAVAIWLYMHADPEILRTDTMIMLKISRWPQLILLGVWASTLSSALGSALAAPRTLQALAYDRIVPRFVGRQIGSATEPRMAVLITTALALMVVFMGQLNMVAKLITMFFLNTYAMINMTAGLETLIRNPSFRPGFNVPWPVSLIGGLGCYAAMVLIHPGATVIAVLVSYGIFFMLKRQSLNQRWGDLRTGFWIALVRTGMLRLQHLPLQPKNWRPNIVAFTGTPGTAEGREPLMKMAVWLSQAGGIVTLSHLLVGDPQDIAGKGYRQTSHNRIQGYLKERGASAFGASIVVADFYQGVMDIAQAHGLVSTTANTVMLGWAGQASLQERQLRLMYNLLKLEKSVLFLKYDSHRGYGNRRQIDVWWRGRDRNAQLMLMIAHIIGSNKAWDVAEIRLIRLLESPEGARQADAHLSAFIKKVRVRATPVVRVVPTTEESFADTVARNSADTDLVLLGLPEPRDRQIRTQAFNLRHLLQPLPTTLLVRSAEVDDILEAGDSGT